MAMTECPECDKPVSESAKVCPNCGHRLRMGAFGKLVLWSVGGVVAFLAFGFMLPKDEAKSRARDAISLCWSEQGRKSATPGEARFIAGTCESMEADFQRKYGVRP